MKPEIKIKDNGLTVVVKVQKNLFLFDYLQYNLSTPFDISTAASPVEISEKEYLET